jgi:hypothetical protein
VLLIMETTKTTKIVARMAPAYLFNSNEFIDHFLAACRSTIPEIDLWRNA